MKSGEHILVTGGAGYIGSAIVAHLLRNNYLVTVVDNLLYGGDSMLGFLSNENLHIVKADVCEAGTVRLAQRRDWPNPTTVLHMAALAGARACQAVGREIACRYNVEGTQRAFEQAEQLGAQRFLFPSTYSVYANDQNNESVREDAPLAPNSLYSETKILAEDWLRTQAETASCTALILRQATAYGLSPRIRFDLLVNQFVLEAFIHRELIIYQRSFSRSFVHIADAVHGYELAWQTPLEKIRPSGANRVQVFNLGSERGNYTKDEITNLVLERFPEVVVRYKDLPLGGDQRDLTVSFEKIKRELGFESNKTIKDGVDEVAMALSSGMIRNPYDRRYRNVDTLIH